MTRKVLVTGGAGYIGSHVVNLLGKIGDDIIILDNLSTGRKESILYGRLVEGQLEDLELVEKLFVEEKFDAVIHFAGSIIVPESVKEPIKYYKNNAENSLHLIELCLKHKVPNFIFSSTAAVYGMPESGEASEESPTQPINPYGRSKLMTEWCLEDAASANEDFNFIALRYFNVAGGNVDGLLGQCSPFSTHLIKIACEAALGKREKMSIYGTDYATKDGTCIRDYIHIDDLAQAHLDGLSYLMNEKQSHILNCGYGMGYTVREVIETVKRVSGVDFVVEEGPRREGDPPSLTAKAEKVGKVLGWVPKYKDLDLMVKTAYEWEKKL